MTDRGETKNDALTLVTSPRAATENRSNSGTHSFTPHIFFTRIELGIILRIYGFKVSEGEWRDYAMGSFKDSAVFAVFRRTSEVPLYRIEKHPKLARKQGAFRVVAATGLILKRGHDLAQVLSVFEKPTLRLVD